MHQKKTEKVEIDNLLAPSSIDSCCGSTFFLNDGTPTGGPVSLPLKQYYTSSDGSYLYISN